VRNNCLRNNDLNRICILAIVILTLFLTALSTLAAEKPVNVQGDKTQQVKYPPYPDVWGYEFPWPAENDRFSHIRVTRMDDGDIFVTYVKKTIISKIRSNYIWSFQFSGIQFFSGHKKDFTEKEYNGFWGQHRKGFERISREMQIIFEDKSIIKRVSKDYGKPDADRLLRTYITKEDKDGNIIWRKNIIYMPVKPLRKELRHDPVDDRNDALKNKYLTKRVVDVFPMFVPLQDYTFLLYDMEGNFIIRLDKDLKTKNGLMNSRIFLIDSEIVEKIEDKLNDDEKYNDQTINDALYNYILNFRKDGGR
jgi:hypothetical protein